MEYNPDIQSDPDLKITRRSAEIEQLDVHKETARDLLSLKESISTNSNWEAWEESRRAADEEFLAECFSLFHSENPERRREAAWMTPQIIPSYLRAMLQPVLHDLMGNLIDDPDVRVRVEIAKSWFFHRNFPDLAIRIHHDPSAEVRAACASHWLIHHWDEKGIIRDYLRDKSPLVRAAMVKRWNPLMPFTKDVVALVYDEAPEVQRAVQNSASVQYILGYWRMPLFIPGFEERAFRAD